MHHSHCEDCSCSGCNGALVCDRHGGRGAGAGGGGGGGGLEVVGRKKSVGAGLHDEQEGAR